MSNKEQKPASQDELSEQQLDKVAGGQEVVKIGKITVTAKREQPQQVVKVEKIVVAAQREKPDLAGAQLASAEGASKKN